MIHSHLIAKLPSTPVYAKPGDITPGFSIPEGSWMGVLDEEGEWIHILAIENEGWVRRIDVESLPPLKLHAVWAPGKPIEYKFLSNAS